MNRCGTTAGYRYHYRHSEIPCMPCKEAQSKINKKYYIENTKKINIRNNQYHINNPEKRRSSERRRRSNKFNNGYSPYKESDVIMMYGSLCHICLRPIDLSAPRRPGLNGWENGLHIDHLLALSRGGADTIENVRPAHGSCNIKKQASPFPNNSYNAIIE